MRYFFNITVKGRGGFPIDMLRYAACYPRTEEDSGTIVESLTCPMMERTITVALEGTMGIALNCIERFKSFGWDGEITYEERI